MRKQPSLQKGKVSLAEKRPDLVIDWHPTKNGDLTPDKVSVSSSRNVWWLGNQCQHTWKTVIADRNKGNNCPICANTIVIAGANDLKSKLPDVARLWDKERNKDLTPCGVTCFSGKKVYWQCKLGHQWQREIKNQVQAKYQCPFCGGVRVEEGVNDLKSLYPETAKGWDFSKNIDLRPWQVLPASRKNIWWICSRGHSYQMPVNARKKGRGCPICSGHTVFLGFNDLRSTHFSLALEWYPTKNGNLTPEQVSAGSSHKIFWIGKCGHEWSAVIADRSRGRGCPRCVKNPSKLELKLYQKINCTYPSLLSGACLPISWGAKAYTSIDILLPTKKVIIEYDGWYWHKDKFKQDRLKTQALLDAGYKVIRVRAKPLRTLRLKHPNFKQISYPHGAEHTDTMAKEIIGLIRSWQ